MRERFTIPFENRRPPPRSTDFSPYMFRVSSHGLKSVLRKASSRSILLIALIVQSRPVLALTGAWQVPAGGTWGTAANWSGGVPDDVGATADFSQAPSSSNTATVTLGAPRTVGSLIFGNQTGQYYNLQDASYPLILATASGTPTIVDQGHDSSRLSVLIAGTQGFSYSNFGTGITDGLWLMGPNSYTGPTTISNGALQMGFANTLPATSPVTVAGGATLRLNGFNQSIGSLSGAGTVVNDSNTNASLTIGSDNSSPTFSGVLNNDTTGATTGLISLFAKVGSGVQTLTAPAATPWLVTGNGGGYDLTGPTSGSAALSVSGGTLALDLSQTATTKNLINPYYTLRLAGGTLAIDEPSGSAATSQAFNGATIGIGASTVIVNTNGNTNSAGFALGTISRSAGGTVDFSPGSATTGGITTTAGNFAASIFGGWATYAGGATWAVSSSDGVNPGTISGLNSFATDAWAAGNNTTVTANSSPAGGSMTNSLRFNAAGPTAGGFSVALVGANTIASGGILVTPLVGANGATIGGSGSLTSGNGTDLIIGQFDSSGPLTISPPIVGSIGLTKSGSGSAILSGGNSYSGPTTVNGGLLEFDGASSLGANSPIRVNNGTLRFKVTSGTPSAGSNITATVAAGAVLELGGAVAALGSSVNVADNSQVATTGGLYVSGTNQQVGTITGAGNMVVAAGASITAYQIVQNALVIHGTGTTSTTAGMVTLAPSGSGSTSHPTNPNNVNFSSTLGSLSIDSNNQPPEPNSIYFGTLDIGNNGLVIPYGSGADPYATIVDMIRSGYAAGHWTGTGISSSLAGAAADSQSPLNIGLKDFMPGRNGDPSSIVFQGQTVTTSAVLIRLTYMDDLILAGDMSQGNATSDALRFAANFGTGTTWSVGDLNHDGAIDTGDALIFAANFVVGLPSLDGTTGNSAAIRPGLAEAVPEPSSVLLVVLGALTLGAGWRRN